MGEYQDKEDAVWFMSLFETFIIHVCTDRLIYEKNSAVENQYLFLDVTLLKSSSTREITYFYILYI